jgi:Nucleotidyltransferase
MHCVRSAKLIKFSAMVVSASGHMARMNTVAPTSFTSYKLWMAEQKSRDPLKRNRDLMQAKIVEELATNYLVATSALRYD